MHNFFQQNVDNFSESLYFYIILNNQPVDNSVDNVYNY